MRFIRYLGKKGVHAVDGGGPNLIHTYCGMSLYSRLHPLVGREEWEKHGCRNCRRILGSEETPGEVLDGWLCLNPCEFRGLVGGVAAVDVQLPDGVIALLAVYESREAVCEVHGENADIIRVQLVVRRKE